jgi:hypothetical protein
VLAAGGRRRSYFFPEIELLTLLMTLRAPFAISATAASAFSIVLFGLGFRAGLCFAAGCFALWALLRALVFGAALVEDFFVLAVFAAWAVLRLTAMDNPYLAWKGESAHRSENKAFLAKSESCVVIAAGRRFRGAAYGNGENNARH